MFGLMLLPITLAVMVVQRWQKHPVDVHMIGKDISRFHAALWPAMLISCKLSLPKLYLYTALLPPMAKNVQVFWQCD